MKSREPGSRKSASRAAHVDKGARVARRERIVDAAERLFAERGFHSVTVRDIAREARVTHPLVYYYWKSKEELLAATLERSQSRVLRASGSERDPLDDVMAMVRESLDHNRHYLRTLTRALLDGMSPSEWPGGYPGVEAGLERLTAGAEPGGEEDLAIRERFACALAAMLGWALVEEQLLQIVGLTAEHGDRGRQVLLSSIRDILEPAAPGARAEY